MCDSAVSRGAAGGDAAAGPGGEADGLPGPRPALPVRVPWPRQRAWVPAVWRLLREPGAWHRGVEKYVKLETILSSYCRSSGTWKRAFDWNLLLNIHSYKYSFIRAQSNRMCRYFDVHFGQNTVDDMRIQRQWKWLLYQWDLVTATCISSNQVWSTWRLWPLTQWTPATQPCEPTDSGGPMASSSGLSR